MLLLLAFYLVWMLIEIDQRVVFSIGMDVFTILYTFQREFQESVVVIDLLLHWPHHAIYSASSEGLASVEPVFGHLDPKLSELMRDLNSQPKLSLDSTYDACASRIVPDRITVIH